MSFEYDIESAVREAIRRGSHSDYSYRRSSRRYAAVGVPGPRLVDQGAGLAIVVELSPSAAEEHVDEAREGLSRALRQSPLHGLALIGPEVWADWANQCWETRPQGTLEAEHLEANPGDGLVAINELDLKPSVIVVITDQTLHWPVDVDCENVVAVAVPLRSGEGTADGVDHADSAAIEVIRVRER